MVKKKRRTEALIVALFYSIYTTFSRVSTVTTGTEPLGASLASG